MAMIYGYETEDDVSAACVDCRYFFQNDEDKQSGMGECRRNPPTGATFENMYKFPYIQDVFWCGEWKLRLLANKTCFDGISL
jgi:hypothetical protein